MPDTSLPPGTSLISKPISALPPGTSLVTEEALPPGTSYSKVDSLDGLENLLRATPLVTNKRPPKPLSEMLNEDFKLGKLGQVKSVAPLGPSDPRSFLGEVGASAVRGSMDALQHVATSVVSLTQGPEEALKLDRIAPFGPQPSRDPSSTSNLVGGLLPYFATGPGGAVLGGASGYARTLERTQNNEAALAAGVVGTALGLARLGGVSKPISNRAVRLAVDTLASGTVNAATSAANEAIARVGGAEAQEVDLGLDFAVGALTHVALAPIHRFTEIRQRKQFEETRRELAKTNLLSDIEIAQIGDRPSIIDQLVKTRLEGKQVEIKSVLDANGTVQLTSDGLPKLSFKVTADPVSQVEKAALGFAEPMIEAYRTHLSKGGKRFFIEPSRLPVTQEEASSVAQRLNTLANKLTENIKPEEFGPDGTPLTERALLLVDAGKASTNLLSSGTGPGSRLEVERSNALLDAATRFQNSSRPIRPGTLSTPIDLRPTQAPWLPLPQTVASGLLKPAKELVDRPSLQRRVEQLQRKTMERLSVLQDTSRFTVADKVRLSMLLDAEHVEKMGILLNKNNNDKSGVKKRVVKDIVDSPIPAEQQPAVIDSLNKAIDLVSEQYPTETMQGTIRRLIDESADPKYGLSPDVTVWLVQQYIGGLKGKSRALETQLAESRVQLKELLENFTGYGLEEGRAKLTDLVRNLPDEVSAPFLKQALDAKSQAELTKLGEEVAGVHDTYLHESTSKEIQKLARGKSLELNPQRNALLDLLGRVKARVRLAPAEAPNAAEADVAPAKGQPEAPKAGSSASLRPAIVYEGKTYVSDISHTDAIQQALVELTGVTPEEASGYLAGETKLTPENKATFKVASKLLLTPEEASVFVDSAGKVYSRKEATEYANKNLGADIRQGEGTLTSEDAAKLRGVEEVAKTTKPTKPKKDDKPFTPILITEPSTGKITVDTKALARAINTLPTDALIALRNEIKSVLRKGEIERGLYQKALKFSKKQDVQATLKALSKLPKRSKFAQDRDTLLDNAKLALDNKSVESALEQMAQGDLNSPLLDIFHGQFRDPYNRHLQNRADTRRFASRVVRETLGLEVESVRGQNRLARYLGEVLPGGLTRDRAMRVYAWSTDSGRVTDLRKYGVEVAGEKFDIDAAVASLSKKDKAFVDLMKGYFQNNPFVEKSFSNVLLLKGYEPPRVKGWYPSARTPEKVHLEADFNTLEGSLMRDIDPLHEREENLKTPFDVSQGFYSSFLNVSDKLSTFAELGKELFRAQSLLIDRKFESAFRERNGKAAYRTLQMYLSNIGGQLGHQNTALDAAINKLQAGFAVSRVGLSLWSAATQVLDVFTMMAEGSLSVRAVANSLLSGAPVSGRVRREMQANSGLAYSRYTGGEFLQHMLVQADENRLPTKFTVAQHYSMVAQRMVDQAMMQTAWYAAEQTIKGRGLKGLEAREATQRLFNEVVGRSQPTDNPLYASQLELEAKRQPLLRAALTFQRQQNRVYNVMRRHVVKAVQQPTTANVSAAGKALFFGLVVNTVGIVALRELRRLAYDRETTNEGVALDVVGNIAGLYYLSGPVETMVSGIIDFKRQSTDRALSPIASIAFDVLGKTPWHIYNAISADDREVASGVARGESVARKEMIKAFDSALSGSSSLLGLPLWSVWQQARGLYVWTDPETQSMVHFQREKEQLKADGDEKSSRYQELEKVSEAINELHRKREKGLLSQSVAGSQIIRELSKAGF